MAGPHLCGNSGSGDPGSAVQLHAIDQRDFLFLLRDAVLTPAAHRPMGHLLGLLVPAQQHGPAAPHRVEPGAAAGGQYQPWCGRLSMAAVVPVHAIVWLSPLGWRSSCCWARCWSGSPIEGIRKDKAEGWLALPAVVLVVISFYQEELLCCMCRCSSSPLGWGSRSPDRRHPFAGDYHGAAAAALSAFPARTRNSGSSRWSRRARCSRC